MVAKKKPMTKGEIVTNLAEKFKVSKRAAASMIEDYVNLAIVETKKKGVFVLPGIGKSTLVKRKARKGRNPQSGEEIKIPAKTVLKMRFSKAFKDAVLSPK